ncbi:LOW QUALITY PROTEIN: A-kinase anchor protein 17B-like [Ctenodactylus gundi]
MMVTVVYDNSEATELCAAQHLYLQPIAKLMIDVLVPESVETERPFSNWEVLDQLKSLICPDQFTTVRLSKSTKDFIRFEGEVETRSLVQILKAKLHGKIIKLNGMKTDLKVVVTDAHGEWEQFPKEKKASLRDGAEEQDHDKSLDSIHFKGLPCKWFAPIGSSGERPCEEILREVFESFGKIKNVDIPMLDPYREAMTVGSFGGFSFGLQTFEAFIQYQESAAFLKAMESLRGMKLMLKGDDGKALACNIKVMFDKTKHFSERAIRKRNQEKRKLQKLEEKRRKEKKREKKLAEKKRKGEERKYHGKRKKAKDRRQTRREKKSHRQGKSKVKDRDEEPQESGFSQEWEERKCQLDRRQVEASRLMCFLLRKVLGSTQLGRLEVDVTGPKTNQTPGNTLETRRGELNVRHLRNQEEMPKHRVAKSNRKRKHKMKKRTRTHSHKSSYYLEGKKLRYSRRKERSEKLLTDGYNYSLASDQNSLQITTQGQSLERKDHYSKPHKASSSRLAERYHSRKQKIYETDEFINYLLNCYQTPQYPRMFPEPSDITCTCQWQRYVCAKGNGFQISLKKHRHYLTNLKQMENLEREQAQEDNDCSMICTQNPEHKPQKGGTEGYTEGYTKRFDSEYKDTAGGADDQLTPTDGESRLLEETPTHLVKDSESTRRHQVSSPFRSVNSQLKDCLEEISSNSECFSETLSINKEKKEESVATYHSSPEERILDPDEIITCEQKTRSRQQTLYLEGKHSGEENYSKPKLKTSGKRSKSELRCSWLEGESGSIQEESSSKQRERPAHGYLLHEGYYCVSGSSDQLEEITKKRRRVSDNTFDHAKDFYLGYFFPKQEVPGKSEYNQDARSLKRHEIYSMLNSDNFCIRHDKSTSTIESV